MNTSRTLLRTAFTLVELLVVIAIIGILVGLLLPAVQAAREAARRSQCTNNLKQIALAVLNYESSNKRFPAGHTIPDRSSYDKVVNQTWTVDILPYMEQQAVYDLWDKDTPISTNVASSSNQQLRSTIIATYRCPSDQFENDIDEPASGPRNGKNWAVGSYRANSGRAGVGDNSAFWDDGSIDRVSKTTVPSEWRGPIHARNLKPEPIPGSGEVRGELMKPVALRQITDGLSNTLLVGEYHTLTSPRRKTFWAYGYTSYNLSGAYPESATLLADFNRCEVILKQIDPLSAHACKRAWGSMHSGGLVQFGKCDGSVFSVSTDVDLEILLAVSTIQNGEVVTLD